MINKAPGVDKDETNEDIDDPTWDKENDREDDDDAFDFSPSSDDDWKPSLEKKRPRREISFFSSEGKVLHVSLHVSHHTYIIPLINYS